MQIGGAEEGDGGRECPLQQTVFPGPQIIKCLGEAEGKEVIHTSYKDKK